MPLGLQVQDACGVCPFPDQLHHPGWWCRGGDPQFPWREGTISVQMSPRLRSRHPQTVRHVTMLEGVTIYESKAQKDEYILEGTDVQNVSQSGAS